MYQLYQVQTKINTKTNITECCNVFSFSYMNLVLIAIASLKFLLLKTSRHFRVRSEQAFFRLITIIINFKASLKFSKFKTYSFLFRISNKSLHFHSFPFISIHFHPFSFNSFLSGLSDLTAYYSFFQLSVDPFSYILKSRF